MPEMILGKKKNNFAMLTLYFIMVRQKQGFNEFIVSDYITVN